jgi:hypothetical protein
MDQYIPLTSLLMALNGRDSLAALRGDSDPFAALRGDSDPFAALRNSNSLAAILSANPRIGQMAPSKARDAMYELSVPDVGSQTP